MNKIEYISRKYTVYINKRKFPVEIPNTNRVSLAELFAEFGFKIGAEIGTERGIYAQILCKKIPGLRLYCVDPWKPYKNYRDSMTKEEINVFFDEAKSRLAPYDVKFIKKFSLDAVKDIPDNSLDFVYIDANHEFRHVVDDISEWEKKVRKGGIVAGHDYVQIKRNAYLMAVPFAVVGYTRAYQIKPWFILGRKSPGKDELRDGERSWFWVKT